MAPDTYGLPSSRTANGLDETMKWYGSLWSLFLGLMSEVELEFLHDPTWVQHAFNFALFPVGLYGTERLLERAGVRRSTAVLAVALLFGTVRFGGHALVNVNDFPMAMLSLLVMLYLWTKLREADAGARATGSSCWSSPSRYFGRSTMSNALPRWYPFVWLPVMLCPAAFLVFLWALGRGAFRGSLAPQSFLLPTAQGGTIDLSLRRWLAIHAALLWLGVLVLHPTIYDEERHLLFLYPPLLVLAALGLDDLGERLKYGLVVLVVATACGSYVHWGRYAYVYGRCPGSARTRLCASR